jgi:hypothetical protein
MKKYMLILMFLTVSGFCFAADSCSSPTNPKPSIDTLLNEKGADFCPGDCQDIYKVPAATTVNIWYKGSCKKITNLSKTQPVFIPAKDGSFLSSNPINRAHPTLKCVGDFHKTKDHKESAECKRGVAIKAENCDGPYFEYVLDDPPGVCFPGCRYLYTEDEERDNSTTPPKIIKPGISEYRYFDGTGSPCTYPKRVRLMWNGISRHNPNDSAEIITNTPYELSYKFDEITCTRLVPDCSGSAGNWICYTCKPGWMGGCTNASGTWDDKGQPPGQPVPDGVPEQSGGATVSY